MEKLKVGDWVYVIDNGVGGRLIGDMVQITYIFKNESNNVFVSERQNFNHRGDWFYYRFSRTKGGRPLSVEDLDVVMPKFNGRVIKD
jgi:hypothetical protein